MLRLHPRGTHLYFVPSYPPHFAFDLCARTLSPSESALTKMVGGWPERLTKNQQGDTAVAAAFRSGRFAASKTAGTKLRRRRPSIPIGPAGSRLRSGG